MQTVLIGTYSSTEDAARTRDELLAAGVPAADVRLHGPERADPNEPLPEDQGLVGFIARMFSGATGDPSSFEKYLGSHGTAAVVLARVAPERATALASVMRQHGSVHVHAPQDAAAPPPVDVTGAGGSATREEAIATVAPTQRNASPNSPGDWDTSRGGSPSTIGDIGHDPARPQADLDDAGGLDTDAHGRRAQPSGAPDGRRAADTAPSSDALRERVAERVPGRTRSVGKGSKAQR